MGHVCPEGKYSKQWKRWDEWVRNMHSQLRSAAGRAQCASAPSDACFFFVLLWLHFKSCVRDSSFGGFVQIHLTGLFLHNRVDLFSYGHVRCLGRRSVLVDHVIVSSWVWAGEAVQRAFLDYGAPKLRELQYQIQLQALNIYDGGRCQDVKQIKPQCKYRTGLRTGSNGGSLNIWVFFHSSVATGPRVRTKTITMTDMKRSSLLIAPRCMLGTEEARRRVKPGPEASWGKQIITDGGKKAECFCLPTHHTFMITLYHSLCGLQQAELFFFCLQILAVGTLRRCTFNLWSLARQKSVPRLPPLLLPVCWSQFQLVCEG